MNRKFEIPSILVKIMEMLKNIEKNTRYGVWAFPFILGIDWFKKDVLLQGATHNGEGL